MTCRIVKQDGKIVAVEGPNGNESAVFSRLAKDYGLVQAYSIYSFARTKEFADWFGGTWDRLEMVKAKRPKNIALAKDNVKKILDGTKTTTLRAKALPSGIYQIGSRRFYLTNRGNLTLEEAGGAEAIKKSEDFGRTGPKYQHTKDFLKGKRKLYVIDIKSVEDEGRGFKLSKDTKKKDQGKADLSNAYIGFGLPGTSTSRYASDARKAGLPTNDELYDAADKDTIAFVSVNGNNKATPNMIAATTKLAREIIERGGTVIMDSNADATRKWNEFGEKIVQENLGIPTGQTSKGYNYWGSNPEDVEVKPVNKAKAAFQDSIFTDDNGEPKLVETAEGLAWVNLEGEYRLVENEEFTDYVNAEAIAINSAASHNDPELEAEILDVISGIAIMAMKQDSFEYFLQTGADISTKKGQSKFLDRDSENPMDKGVLAKSVLALSFRNTNITEEVLDATIDYFKLYKDSEEDIDAVADQMRNDGFTTIDPIEMEIFFEVYDYWEDVVETKTGNVTEGYRSMIQKRLAYHSILMQDGESFIEETEEGPQKIYDRSVFEEDPTTKLSAEAKRALQGIAIESTFLSINKPMPISEVHSIISKAAINQNSMAGIINKLTEMGRYNPNIAPIIERLKTLEPREVHAVTSALTLTLKTFTIVKTTKTTKRDREGRNVTRTRVDIFNPNVTNTSSRYRTRYIRNSRRGAEVNDRAIYQIVEDTQELEVIQSKLQEAEEALDKVETISKTRTRTESVPKELSDALGEYLWALGMQFNESLESTQEALAEYFKTGRRVGKKYLKGMQLFKHFMESDGKYLGRPLLDVVKSGKDIYAKETATIKKVAAIAHLFDQKDVGSFINATGSQIWPLNYPTALDEHSLETSQNLNKKELDRLMEDPLFKPSLLDDMYTSRLLLKLKNSKKFREAYVLEYLDAFNNDGAVFDYEGLSELQSLILRLNKYINKGGENTKIAIPVQADRGNLNFISGLRYSTKKADRLEILKGFIVQDYARMAAARATIAKAQREKDTSILAKGYHYNKIEVYEDGSFRIAEEDLGGAFTRPQIEKYDQDGNVTFKDVMVPSTSGKMDSLDTMSTVINDYLAGELDPDIAEFVEEEIASQAEYAYALMQNAAVDIKDQLGKNGIDLLDKSALNTESKVKINPTSGAFLLNFVFDDVVGRMEIGKMLRGGYSFSKNIEDYYKRMKLVSTPGVKPSLQGNSSKDPNSGMPKTFKQLVILDVDFVNKDAADATAERMYENLGLDPRNKKNAKAEARRRKTADQYKHGTGIEKGDAQGIISPSLYRGIMDGFGAWFEKDEEAYQNHKSKDPSNPYAGKWVDNEGVYRDTYPLKPYNEQFVEVGDERLLVMDKNSFTVLTYEKAEGNEAYQRMMRAFEAGIDVINPVSASKGAKINPQNIYEGELDASNPIVMDSSKLRFPQMIPRKDQKKAKFSIQVRKNAIANVVEDGEYIVGGRKISGAQLKEAMHDVVSENVEDDSQKLLKRISLQELYDAKPGTQEFADAKLKYLQAIREVMLSQRDNKSIGDNYIKGLDIIANGKYDYQFTVPIAFPAFQDKFQQIFLSTFKKSIFDQYIKGKDLVQVAEVGGYGVDPVDLQMYDGVNRAEVRVRRSVLGLSPDVNIEDVDPKKLEFMLYRTPNQGKNSTLPVKVVEFLPENYAKAIMVPGGITRQMGSDFDIDKATIILREDVDVSVLDSPKSMTRKERDALLYDLVDSIITSPLHLIEVLDPLDSDVLDDMAKSFDVEEVVDPLNPLVEITMEGRNKTGQTMTGIYANFLSGRNVLESKTNKLVVRPGYEVKLKFKNGEEAILNELGTTFDIDGVVTDSNISAYLSVAVDASNNPIHVAINDNRHTGFSTGYMLTVGNAQETTTPLMAMEYVRKAVKEHMEDTSKGFKKRLRNQISSIQNYYKGFSEIEEYAASIKDEGTLFMEVEHLMPDANAKLMSVEDLESLEKGTAKYDNEIALIKRQITYLHNLVLFTEVGTELQELNKLITPDTQKNVNEMSALTAFIEAETAFFNKKEPIIVGGKEFIEADGVYRTSAAFRKVFQTMLNAAEVTGFINNRPAFYGFKENLKVELGIKTLNAAQHKFIDRILFLKMLSDNGGPLSNLMSQEVFEDLFLSRGDNIATRLEAIVKRFPKLENNLFIKILEPHPGNKDFKSKVFTIRMSNAYSTTSSEKTLMSKDFFNLINSPEAYVNTEGSKEEMLQIKRFAKQVIANQFLTSGFLPGSGSYMELMPSEFFSTRVLSGDPISVSPVQHFRHLSERTLDPNYFRDFVQDFIRNFGLVKQGYSSFVATRGKESKKNRGQITLSLSEVPQVDGIPASYVAAYNRIGDLNIYALQNKFTDSEGVERFTYQRMQPLGFEGRVHEVLSDRPSSSESLVPAPGRDNLIVLQPAYVAPKVEKLKELDRLSSRTLPESVVEPLMKVCKI